MPEQNFVEKMQAILKSTAPVNGSVPPKPYPRVSVTADVCVKEYHSVDIELTSEDHDDERDWNEEEAEKLICNKLGIGLSDDLDIDYDGISIVNQDELDAWEEQYGDDYDADGNPLDEQGHSTSLDEQGHSTSHDDDDGCH